MTTPGPVFHWFLPTGGDSRTLGPGSHGVRIGAAAGGAASAAGRPPTLGYLTRLATAVESLGFTGMLTPTGAHCEDAWLTTAALLPATRTLRFMVAFRSGLVAPVLAAQMASTYQRLSGGRLLLNLVAGSSDAELRAYGDGLAHDERYDRAQEYLDVVDKSLSGRRFDHDGRYYRVEGGHVPDPARPRPPLYFGGSSQAAVRVAARWADVYLTWGEPVEQVAEKIATARTAAAGHGREPRFGLRVHVVTRETADEAWAAAERLIAGVDDDMIAVRRRELAALESVGQSRMLALHGGDRDRLVVAPNLWAGIGLVRGGAGTALVGSHDEVAARIEEYRAAGVDEFVLSGYPHLEEAYHVGEGVLPRFGVGPTATEGAVP
ncbi:LLM class flavin-dependent oxidoreductase [Pseudonocardia sp. N23]|uniref:LLM class flavin-dependent oxidoreductase n=1 Tax=Pseudonocardia sp. N23 TaxID=1987376 RepID=UPI000BFC6F90|nr:LLM class flavin-dependent oxidoreductase [Pseudonocardia sp. N23]GAY07999.1 alkanesulfonate monooxygenase [Pseudonocardia sp. N23]